MGRLTARTPVYRAVYQFFDAFENNSNFGQKVFTGTDFRSKFVKMVGIISLKVIYAVLAKILNLVPCIWDTVPCIWDTVPTKFNMTSYL